MRRRFALALVLAIACVATPLAAGCSDADTAVGAPADPPTGTTKPITSPDGATPSRDGGDASDGAGPNPPPPKPLPIPADDPPTVSVPLLDPEVTTPIGMTGFTVSARIQPRGQRLKWHVEYGKTPAYGMQTSAEPLGPRLAAYYRESWETNLGGWGGGLDGAALVHRATGGASGGHVRFVAPGDADANHLDGIGYLELPQYLHNGTCVGAGIVNPYLGGGDTDLRDAKIALDVRGTGWSPDLSELHFWVQSDSDLAEQNDLNWRRANWAFTDVTLTDALLLGGWQHVEYRLANDASKWSYAGRMVDQNRPNYQYWPLENALRHANCDVIHALVLNDAASAPSGSADFDEMTINYRNHSLLLRSNGGRLVSAPAGSTDPAALTDGWRHGAGRTWASAPNPTGPQEIVYSFVRPVTINAVQIHQNPIHRSRHVEVLVSTDGLTWKLVSAGFLPDTSSDGPNLLQLFERGLSVPAQHVKVRVLSGYAPIWGLGEIEIFGTGAVMGTDDDWYNSNADITGLEAGTTYHYRVVVSDGVRTTYGTDRTVATAATPKPDLSTGAATRMTTTGAKLDGRLTPMGLATDYWFELGTDTSYGESTPLLYAGVELTPRTVVGRFDTLSPATTYHYRLVATSSAGTTYGADRTFTTK